MTAAAPPSTDAAAGASSAPRRDDVLRGIGFMCLSVLVFATMNVVVKWQSSTYPVGDLVFFRSVFALVPCAVLIRRSGGLATLRTTRPLGHAVRSGVWLASMVCTFLSYHLLPLAEAVSIGFSAPLFLTALSGPVLGERVGTVRWAAVLAGFAGVLIMLRPGGDFLEWGAVFALGNAVFYALGMLAVRELSRSGETSSSIVFFQTLLAAVVATAALPFYWVTPSLADAAIMASLGLGGGVGTYWMTEAFRHAPASTVAPFNYTSMIWATLFGFVIWGELPTALTIAGSTVVIGSGLFILRHETRTKRRTAATAPPSSVIARRATPS
ncbi:MAG TPA: DMT family transporter [Stellaceae bacterium]|jgi:drug/metabolite transporter (DMT)-like permease